MHSLSMRFWFISYRCDWWMMLLSWHQNLFTLVLLKKALPGVATTEHTSWMQATRPTINTPKAFSIRVTHFLNMKHIVETSSSFLAPKSPSTCSVER